MDQIYVDTAALRHAAAQLEQFADRFLELEGEVMRAAASAPSYDGQFSPRVAGLAAEAASALQARRLRLIELAEILNRKATEFEEADQEALSVFDQLGLMVSRWLQTLGFSSASEALAWAQRTPTPPIDAVRAPSPEPVGTPVPVPSHGSNDWTLTNSRYGFCVYPLTDPDALENHIAEAGVTFGKGPFNSSPRPASGPPYDGIPQTGAELAMKGFGLLSSPLRQMANERALARMQPNVDVKLHYARYEDGTRLTGLEVHNDYSLPIVFTVAQIVEGTGLDDGTFVAIRVQDIRIDEYVLPDTIGYLEFEGLAEEAYSGNQEIRVQILGASVEYERQFRPVSWVIDLASGEAHQVPPAWVDSN